MAAFDGAIELAKRQLPGAFTIGGSLPYSGAGDPRRLPLEEGAFANAIGSVIPSGTEDLRDWESSYRELGFEAMAFYVSFHRPMPDGLWGIFYFDHRVRQFAEKVRREFHLKDVEAARLAIGILRAHELFHFRFDVYGLYNELILQKPLYNEYSKCVYHAVYCTADCFEEALANRSCLESEHARRSSGTRVYSTGQIKAFLKEWLRKHPQATAIMEGLWMNFAPGWGDSFLTAIHRDDYPGHSQTGSTAPSTRGSVRSSCCLTLLMLGARLANLH